jgi:hypothetical protein
MEIFKSKDGFVTKFIHDNGAETVLKTGPSCVSGEEIDKKKAVLFISSSVGCQQGCKFCFLTAKKYPFYKMNEEEIYQTAKEAIDASRDILKEKYIKFSFMGMGDCFAYDMDFDDIAIRLFHYVLDNNLVLGLDGIDIGTSMPATANIPGQLAKVENLHNYFKDLYNDYMNPANSYTVYSIPNRDREFPLGIITGHLFVFSFRCLLYGPMSGKN